MHPSRLRECGGSEGIRECEEVWGEWGIVRESEGG